MITSNKHDNICSKMLEHASLSKIRCKHCACLAIGCKIITYGINNERTKWNHELYCCSHSEIQCLYNWWNRQIKGNTNRYRIKEIKKKIKRMTLYIIRKSGDPNLNQVFTNSTPCHLCLSKIKSMNIKKIIFSNDKGKLEKYNTSYLENSHLSSSMKKCLHNKFT